MNTRTGFDRMLRDWAGSKEPSVAHLDKLAAGIRNGIVARRYEEAPAPAGIGLLPRLAYAALGSAVTLGLAAFWVLRLQPVDNGDAARFAAISAQRAAVGGKLFAEMEKLFAEDFRWVAESNGDMDLGVGSLPGGVVRPSVPALVRLTVVARMEGQKTWRQVWNADVMVRSEDRVEISPNRKADNRLAIWLCPLEDGKVAVDTEVALDVPFKGGGRLGTVVPQGVPTEVMTLRSGGTEFRVFQTTTVLKQG